MRLSILIVAVMVITSTANAQSVKQILQSAINKKGENCQAVTATQAIGTSTGGDALIAVACSGGERHVVSIHKDNSVSYVSSCGIFESTTGAKCFSSK
jgi:hypothetical protein